MNNQQEQRNLAARISLFNTLLESQCKNQFAVLLKDFLGQNKDGAANAYCKSKKITFRTLEDVDGYLLKEEILINGEPLTTNQELEDLFNEIKNQIKGPEKPKKEFYNADFSKVLSVTNK